MERGIRTGEVLRLIGLGRRCYEWYVFVEVVGMNSVDVVEFLG